MVDVEIIDFFYSQSQQQALYLFTLHKYKAYDNLQDNLLIHHTNTFF